MGGAPKRSIDSVAQVASAPPGVVAFSLAGYATFATIEAALARASAAIADAAEPRGVVLDLSGVDGFQPGVPAKIVQWTHANRERVCALALVTTSTVWAATLRAAVFMVPDTRFVSVPTLPAAYAALAGMFRSRALAETGVRRKIL
jgi:hypothetical protein